MAENAGRPDDASDCLTKRANIQISKEDGMKRILVAALTAVFFLLLQSCGGGGNSSAGDGSCGANANSGTGVNKQYCSPLIVNYQFEGVTSASIADQSGNDLTLFASGCAIAPGISGNGLACGTSGSAQTTGHVQDFAGQLSRKAQMTLQAWLNFSQNTGTDYIASFDGSFQVYLKAGLIHFSPAFPADVAFTPILNPNTWYNLAITYDGATVKFYLDGTLIQSVSLLSRIGDGFLNDANLKIAPVFSDGHFVGIIDGFRIYDTVLSAADVAANFTQLR
jgi:Concanavalin A-like lectin/glucanases superfamily